MSSVNYQQSNCLPSQTNVYIHCVEISNYSIDRNMKSMIQQKHYTPDMLNSCPRLIFLWPVATNINEQLIVKLN
jgi:hypothetical protein